MVCRVGLEGLRVVWSVALVGLGKVRFGKSLWPVMTRGGEACRGGTAVLVGV